mmetsp:Transcript_116643/g.329921  ORF Transcript_116643/g.329921 Transcript_116643/m.329921 type:complete len:299 (-) Transcript_116643:192-1088(-)
MDAAARPALKPREPEPEPRRLQLVELDFFEHRFHGELRGLLLRQPRHKNVIDDGLEEGRAATGRRHRRKLRVRGARRGLRVGHRHVCEEKRPRLPKPHAEGFRDEVEVRHGHVREGVGVAHIHQNALHVTKEAALRSCVRHHGVVQAPDPPQLQERDDGGEELVLPMDHTEVHVAQSLARTPLGSLLVHLKQHRGSHRDEVGEHKSLVGAVGRMSIWRALSSTWAWWTSDAVQRLRAKIHVGRSAALNALDRFDDLHVLADCQGDLARLQGWLSRPRASRALLPEGSGVLRDMIEFRT